MITLLPAPFIVVIFLFFSTDGSSFDKPHTHRGKLTPFKPGDPKIDLDDEAKHKLASGMPYKTQTESGISGRGFVVQDVHAPPNIVWERILDFDNYSNMVPRTLESKSYNQNVDVSTTKKDKKKFTHSIRMKVGVSLLNLVFFVNHSYIPSLNSLTWTLDYDKQSDLDDSVGFWYVIPHQPPAKNDHHDDEEDGVGEWSRVFYSVEVSMFDWIPGILMDIMKNKALTDATAWVKTYSELDFKKEQQQVQLPGRDKKGRKPRKQLMKKIGAMFRLKQNKKEGQADIGKTDAAMLEKPPTLPLKEEIENIDEAPGHVFENVLEDKQELVMELERIGWSRYVLVFLVYILFLFNINLCLERIG